jgi:1-acyl-sn-glycerol-3-phosphate acyltransferase
MSVLADIFAENPARYDGWSLDQRDEGYIARLMPLFEFGFRYWFRADVDGLNHLPASGPALLVGNHNGGLQTPEAALTAYLWWKLRGLGAPAYGLIHPSVFAVPYLNVHAAKIGGVRAHPRTATAVLERGAVALVYPGGGDDAYRAYSRRHDVVFAERKGFIKLAMRCGVPIVPVVAAGAHETFVVLHDGKSIAQRLGLDRLGIERVPITYAWPLGLSVGASLHLPFPSKVRISIGEPIDVGGVRRDRASVDELYREIHGRMQRRLRELSGVPP